MPTSDEEAFEEYLRSRGWTEAQIQAYVAEAENKAVKSLVELEGRRTEGQRRYQAGGL